MRTRTFIILAAAIVAALALSVSPAGSASPHGITITKDFTCVIDLGGYTAITYDDSIEVDTPSGNAKLSCHFKPDDIIAGGAPDEMQQFEGFFCSTLIGDTRDSSAVITPSGNATLTCQFKA